MIDFQEFAAQLRFAADRVRPELQQVVRATVALGAEKAKGYIGEYQQAEGPFEAWPLLAYSTLFGGFANGHYYKGKVELGYSPPDNPGLRTGDMRGSVHGVAVDLTGVVGSTSREALWFELGTRTQPPRSFLGRGLWSVMPEAEVLTVQVAAKIFGVRE